MNVKNNDDNHNIYSNTNKHQQDANKTIVIQNLQAINNIFQLNKQTVKAVIITSFMIFWFPQFIKRNTFKPLNVQNYE